MDNIPYEITVTVHPRKCLIENVPYNRLRPTEQWHILVDIIHNILQKYPYKIVPELHKNMNIHIHGICFVPNTETQLIIIDKYKYLNQIGRSNFKPISDYITWNLYINKNQKEMLNLSYVNREINYIIENDKIINYRDRLPTPKSKVAVDMA